MSQSTQNKTKKKKKPSEPYFKKETILYSCPNVITCTVAETNPWGYFHQSNLQQISAIRNRKAFDSVQNVANRTPSGTVGD